MPATGKRRAYGQHFLKDKALCQKIAETALDEAARARARGLLEIGPGKGAITLPILGLLDTPRAPSLERWLICEKDRELASYWIAQAGARAAEKKPAVEVASCDFLELDEKIWLQPEPLVVVSNLPYSTGTAMVTRMARHPRSIPSMVLMFQAEVAQRLRAENGTKAWGSLSVWIQNQWDVTRLASVPRGAFSPPPDVQSEVVVLRARPEPRIAGSTRDEASWQALLKACFAHRRKMLRSSLSGQNPYQNALEESGVDGRSRAEALDWGDWDRLFQATLRISGRS